MIRKLLENESGYSLVEVVVSIMILAIAIIPMIAMFDTGLGVATNASNHDKARALAKKQLEQAQSLSYSVVKTNFPNAPCTFSGSGLCQVGNLEVPVAEDPNGEFDGFRYKISKQYRTQSGDAFSDSNSDTGIMQVTVEVGWGGDEFDDNKYIATDVESR